MARAGKSHVTREETTKGGLQPAYSPKVDGHKYVIYAGLKKDTDPYGRTIALKFLATYAARYMVDKLIGNDEWEWEMWPQYEGADPRDHMIRTSSGITIRAHKEQMKEIIEYELSSAEAEWRCDQTLRAVNQFKHGRHEAHNENELPVHSPVSRSREDRNDTENAPEPAAPAKLNRPSEPKQPRVDTSGHTSANDIAKRLGVEGREVRGVLRTLKLEKPAHGWSWPKKEAEAIEAQISKGLKEAKKGKKK
jgi:hypothetical protein